MANAQVANAQVANAQGANAQVANAQVANAQVVNSQVANGRIANAQVANVHVANAQVAATQRCTVRCVVSSRAGFSSMGTRVTVWVLFLRCSCCLLSAVPSTSYPGALQDAAELMLPVFSVHRF